MKLEAIGKPFTYQWPCGEVRFEPGRVIDIEEGRALKIMAKVPGRVRPVEPADRAPNPIEGIPSAPSLRPGAVVEWLSPALPKQRGEVLAVHPDGTFEVFVPITEVVRRLPVAWITRVANNPIELGE